MHTAHHHNAFELDTSKLPEFRVLSHSSDGTLQQVANTTKIHQLEQGTGSTPKTNTMLYIPVSVIPTSKQAMYLHIVHAHHPEKQSHTG